MNTRPIPAQTQDDAVVMRALRSVADAINLAEALGDDLDNACSETGTPDDLTFAALDHVPDLGASLLAGAVAMLKAAEAMAGAAGDSVREARLKPVHRSLAALADSLAAQRAASAQQPASLPRGYRLALAEIAA